jgi:hypothetical protein
VGVGTPIIVEGRLWGVMAAGSRRQEPMAADTEARLTQFTELLATAVANAESRAGLARLAEEQAALRRVATLVARGTRPDEVFARSPTRSDGCSRSIWRTCAATSPTARSPSSPAQGSAFPNIELDARDSILQLAIRDDGVGGADPRRGSGLVGLSDRIEALGGTFQVTSPAGHGTTVLIEVSFEGQRSAGSPER